MDLIEKWFGISPDGGDGSLEALWVGALVLAVVVVAFRRHIRGMVAARANKR